MTPDYIIANGPAGLDQVLTELLAKTLHDSTFTPAEHYILYKLGSQEALIKVDTSQQPFKFWHYDLQGRPATQAIKETIANFLWEKCGAK